MDAAQMVPPMRGPVGGVMSNRDRRREGARGLTDEASQADRRLGEAVGERDEVRRSHGVDEHLPLRGEFSIRCKNEPRSASP